MRKDSELFLRKLLEYREKTGKDSFEINIIYFIDIPNIMTAINDVLDDLIINACLTSKSQLLNLEYDISIYLTLDGIEYFNNIKSKENILQNIINVNEGQFNIATGHGQIDAVVNNNGKNNEKNNINKEIKSRTQEYANKWKQNMFLNNFDKHDKNAGVNIKLKDIYLESHLPHYIWKNDNNKVREDKRVKVWEDLKDLLYEYIYEKNDNKMLLILGQPGIGKSTLITWITANFVDKIDEILVYQFASELKHMDYQNIDDVSDELCNMLNLSYDNLDGKTLILDGFDEINIKNRIEILNSFYWKLIKNISLKQFSLIITCRENYIQDFQRVKFNYITLQPLSEKQIESFCNIYQEKAKMILSKNTISNIIKNKNILGISLILYMVLALDITLENNSSIVDIYDKIFSLKEGGIYDRCIGNAGYADLHRISSIKRQIHLISEKIAFWMFENNSEEEYIPQEEYQKICTSIIQENENENESINEDFLIGNFFKLVRYCEGIESERLYFVHRSIYEYFVTETIFEAISKNLGDFSEKNKEKLAENIATYLKKSRITPTIGEYLQSKILKLYNNFNSEKRKSFYLYLEKTLEKMMNVGMFYYTKDIIYRNIIYKEITCFLNFVDILRLLLEINKHKYIMFYIKKNLTERYIRYCMMQNRECHQAIGKDHLHLNFSRIYLQKMDFRGMDLKDVDFTEADLTDTNLEGMDLTKTVFKNANLKGANLRQVDFQDVDLSGADLRNAKLKGANLKGTCLRGAHLNNLLGVNLAKTDLSGVDFKNANLKGADLREAKLERADFRNADLRNANLWRACMWRANLKEADLRGADLRGASLWSTKLEGSIWLKEDIYKVISQFKYANFSYIIIYHDVLLHTKISRIELLSDIN